MTNPVEIQILESEARLRLAMLSSDVDTLDELLAPHLRFTNHLGQVLTKQDDLTAHQTGILKIDFLVPSEAQIQLVAGVAIVFVRVHLVGSYAGIASAADFRFTRVWAPSSTGAWHVVAAHSTVVTGS
jgi:Domain of unknown function (DUF4440)